MQYPLLRSLHSVEGHTSERDWWGWLDFIDRVEWWRKDHRLGEDVDIVETFFLVALADGEPCRNFRRSHTINAIDLNDSVGVHVDAVVGRNRVGGQVDNGLGIIVLVQGVAESQLEGGRGGRLGAFLVLTSEGCRSWFGDGKRGGEGG